MEILIYLVPLALTLGLLGLVAFLWTLHSNQYEDLDGAAWRAISDDEIGPVRPAPTPEDAVRSVATCPERNPFRSSVSCAAGAAVTGWCGFRLFTVTSNW